MTKHPDPWSAATHVGNRDAQLDSTLAATPAQRLAWLEAALRIAYDTDAKACEHVGRQGGRLAGDTRPASGDAAPVD